MRRPRLRVVETLPGYRLRLVFIDDSTFVVSLAGEFERSPGLLPLKDPEAFSGAVIDEYGWQVEWPALDIQIGADTLWLDAQAQNALDENSRVFAQWRARHGLSLADAARALGMAPRTLSAYGTGARPVPRYIALACKGWEAERGGRN